MRSRFVQAAKASAVEALLGGASTAFSISGDSWSITFTARMNHLEVDGEPEFSLVASDEVWANLIASQPSPGKHSVIHLVRSGTIKLTGDPLAYDRHTHLVRTILDAARDQAPQTLLSRPLTARGEYHRLSTSLGTSDIYVERTGCGPELLALATAGSDTSQWHGVITNSDLTDRYELITVDLPWHGKSSPAWGSPVGSYQLTPDTYTEFIVAASQTLKLDRPVLVGASMAGAAVVHAVATHPNKFHGGVACQVGTSVLSRWSDHHQSTSVNSSLFVPEWTYGLMNPASPDEFKQRVWWGYSSGGYGLYAADIISYAQWDIALVEDLLTLDSPHIAVLSGEFDTSVSPERSRELAQRIPNSSFRKMMGLGHFPHAENPRRFVDYLKPALQRVLKEF